MIVLTVTNPVTMVQESQRLAGAKHHWFPEEAMRWYLFVLTPDWPSVRTVGHLR